MILRLTAGVLATAILAATVIAAPGEPTTRPAPARLQHTTPVVIDGDLSDGCWQTATPVRADYLYGDQGVPADRPRMTAKYAWDDHYLYIAYETFDRNLVALGSGKEDGPPGNRRPGLLIRAGDRRPDVVEFFISFGDVNRSWEIHQNAANQFNDMVNVVSPDGGRARIDNEAWIGDDDDGAHTLKTAVKLKPKADGKPSTVNDDADVDTGYTAEIRIPWAGLGVPEPVRGADGSWRMDGREMRLLAVCQDMDEERYYTHSSPTFNGRRFSQGGKEFPVYRLVQSTSR
jgi:hypothetical protein